MAQNYIQGPVMDWTEDEDLHKRYKEWQDEVELILSAPLNSLSKTAKAGYVQLWAGKAARAYLKSEAVDTTQPKTILTALHEWTKPKCNEIAAFTRLRTLVQDSKSLSEFIQEARTLVDACGYTTDKDRLLRDVIVSGVKSPLAYQRCITKGSELSLADCIKICQSEDSTRRQCEALRPDLRKTAHQEQTEVHRLGYKGKPHAQHAQHWNNSLQTAPGSKRQSCYCCGATPGHPRSKCPARDAVCRSCTKVGHYEKVCRSKRSSVKHIQSQDYPDSLSSPPMSSPPMSTPPDYTSVYLQSGSEHKAPCHMLKTVPVSRLQSPTPEEHIRPLWVSQSRNSTVHEIDCEVDTGAGCNVLPLYKAKELFKE